MVSEATERRIDELMRLPYRMEVRSDPVNGYLATAPELPGCVTAGETPAEAIELLRDAMAAWMESNLERGLPIPEPGAIDERYSGKVLVRMPKSLHGRLSPRADVEGVSTNQLIVALLAEGIGSSLVVTTDMLQFVRPPFGEKEALER